MKRTSVGLCGGLILLGIAVDERVRRRSEQRDPIGGGGRLPPERSNWLRPPRPQRAVGVVSQQSGPNATQGQMVQINIVDDAFQPNDLDHPDRVPGGVDQHGAEPAHGDGGRRIV